MKRAINASRALFVVGALTILPMVRPCSAQGPTVDVQGPPGQPEAQGRLGAPLGSSGISAFDSAPGSQGRPLGGRPGPSASRAPVGALSPPTTTPEREPTARFRPRTLEPANVPRYGELELPARPEGAERPEGLTLDGAI